MRAHQCLIKPQQYVFIPVRYCSRNKTKCFAGFRVCFLALSCRLQIMSDEVQYENTFKTKMFSDDVVGLVEDRDGFSTQFLVVLD